MHVHPHPHSSAGSSRDDRAGSLQQAASSSGGVGRRWFPRIRLTALKPVTYSLMHLSVAITVAYVLTRDWRIALGVGVIEPMVQTLAYMLHEKAWSITGRHG
ncbi:MAG: DUF2061 domain-containing protein [Hyphomonadaceae bacterium]